MIAGMVAKFKVWAVAAALIVGAVLTAFLKGKSNGKAEVTERVRDQHVKDVEAAATKQVETAAIKSDVQQKAITNSDSVIDKELSDKWTR